MTQELYQKAMLFAGEKHSDQKVPGTNSNYLLHISNVAMEIMIAYSNDKNFDLNFAIQTAILHDTIEDTSTNYNEIKDLFGEPIAKAVKALTKDSSIEYKEDRMKDSLNRINELQKEVGIVKIADRITNLQTPPAHWEKEKIIKYCEEAKLILKNLSDKNDYLIKRLQLKIQEYEIKINYS
ncbi:bifunctional (p)ppGpp synthetase/guanosine-3',5'-bis(diphosphate) 3'-pyrophosphohydrolase [Flavobacterium jejuense]|uniref:Bifunctional (P)ppGpp synthetase/guanosine-3',5'-bis(Diphosphate) 3'-pyrophosphohydrolase n=1 Tax=Flavobacterium jejuense TaxID=1544455 RepID=A0ABX0IQZ1_9FLAO|nr:HD domain-containing protein [Flavobacterium jejuense]NHN24309.1 bifunctional (p)ppGpp synthetase/guanosine-3',5'-bis(diphosphate) 3'-pyrophosphohydrolase [Flavobacterium jejuense]